MPKHEFNVLLIEDDPYASNVIMMLLARDYRTRIVAELSNQVILDIFESLDSLSKASGTDIRYIDVVILDTEVPWNEDLPLQIIEIFSSWVKPPKILCTSTYQRKQDIEKFLKYSCFSGYLIKAEVLYSIASAVCLAAEGYFVITPGVRSIAEKELGRKSFPDKALILSSLGMEKIEKEYKPRKEFTRIGRDIIILDMLFNLPQVEIHDELNISQDWIAKIIGKGYEILQIQDIVSGIVSLSKLFTNPYVENSKIINYYQNILKDLPAIIEKRRNEEERRQEQSKSTLLKPKFRYPKFRSECTLAFHLLTIPEIQEW